MNLKEICEPLEDLYSITGLDWNLSIQHNLTEPTCPNISIRPDGTNITRYVAVCDPDKVGETLVNLVKLVHTEVVKGKLLGRAGFPMTNSDDAMFEEWINARQVNKDASFPKEKFYEVINKRFNAK